MSKDEELNEMICEFDIYYNQMIDDIKWEVDFPYHGGAILSPCVFGTQITDDDGNKNLIAEIKGMKESDYAKTYEKFLDGMMADMEADAEDDADYAVLVNKLKDFIANNEPEFYSVQLSS
jgi:hypothetical protein